MWSLDYYYVPYLTVQLDKYNFFYVLYVFSLLQGDYEGKALFYGKSNPDNVLGCVNLAFSVAAGKARDEL